MHPKQKPSSKNAMVFRVACPSCGAPVKLQAASSLMAVCAYCAATLIRQDDHLIDSGEKSSVLKDFSAIQIGTSGIFQKQAFSVIGLWQVVYEQGFWNEWYILFADGQTAWLAEFNGLCSITFPTNETIKDLAFSSIIAGFTPFKDYLAADVRTVDNIACHAQGELPFTHDKLQQTSLHLADFRKQDQFITLDFSDEKDAILYQGQVVHVSALKLKNTRSNEAIKESAGNLRGVALAFTCPQCGYSLQWYPGIAQIVYCQACLSEIQLSSEKIAVNKAHTQETEHTQETTLKLGTVLPLLNKNWTIIGIIKYQELEFEDIPTLGNVQKAFNTATSSQSSEYEVTDDYWYEYLLYCPGEPFIFLTESVSGYHTEWQITHTKIQWPNLNQAHDITTDKGKRMAPTATYLGIVHFAMGAFNWQVGKGDVVFCHNYDDLIDTETDGTGLSVEISTQEISWSGSRALTKQEQEDCGVKSISHPDKYEGYCFKIIMGFLFINILFIINFEPSWVYYIIAIPALVFAVFIGYRINDYLPD